MKKKNNNIQRLERLAAVIKYHRNLKRWYGTVRPDDIIFLIDNKYVFPLPNAQDIIWWRKQIKDGSQSLCTFYFVRPLGTFKELLINKSVSEHGVEH